MPLDLNQAPKAGAFHPGMGENPNFIPEIKAAMEANAEEILFHLFSGGVRRGHEFLVGSLQGERGESMAISLAPGKIGTGEDFATGEKFSDLLDVWCMARYGERARYSSRFAEVVEEVRAWLGMPQSWRKKPPQEKPVSKALPPASASWTYTDPAGSPLVIISRHDTPDGKKEFRPYLVQEGRHAMPKDNRPLYNLKGLTEAQDPYVVVCEGEKTADALISVGITATTQMGGSKAPLDKTDWSVLRGKHVVVWGDADAPGRQYAEGLLTYLPTVGSASVRLLGAPEGVPEGWDAADALAEGKNLHAMVAEAVTRGKERPGRDIDFGQWRSSRFIGKPKPIEWAVQDMVPSGTAGLLVGSGDIGKGWLTLDLALKVAQGKHGSGMFGALPKWLGRDVKANGSAVILAAEDDEDEMHRRLAALHGEDLSSLDNLYTFTLPNAGGPMPLFKSTSTEGTVFTPEWTMLCARLEALGRIGLIVIDPLSSFAQADLDKDSSAGAFVMGAFAQLAAKTGAAVLVVHHMRKGEIESAEAARESVRGSTALVNGVRWVLAVWTPKLEKSKEVCLSLGREWKRGLVAHAAVVKSNAPADREMITLIRDTRSGLLVDVTQPIREAKREAKETLTSVLARVIAHAAAAGHPFQRTSTHGLFENNHRLPKVLRDMPRDSIRALAKEALDNGLIVQARFPGNVQDKWLDVPNGAIVTGRVQSIGQGAYQPLVE